jgi:hypothetical protein
MNNIPDINIVKYLSVNIKKAFDKGEIDKLYKQMYETAESIAKKETLEYVNKTMLEYQEKTFGIGGTDKENSLLIVSKIPDYKNNRIQFHLDQMYKLLELYAKSKNIIPNV